MSSKCSHWIGLLWNWEIILPGPESLYVHFSRYVSEVSPLLPSISIGGTKLYGSLRSMFYHVYVSQIAGLDYFKATYSKLDVGLTWPNHESHFQWIYSFQSQTYNLFPKHHSTVLGIVAEWLRRCTRIIRAMHWALPAQVRILLMSSFFFSIIHSDLLSLPIPSPWPLPVFFFQAQTESRLRLIQIAGGSAG